MSINQTPASIADEWDGRKGKNFRYLFTTAEKMAAELRHLDPIVRERDELKAKLESLQTTLRAQVPSCGDLQPSTVSSEAPGSHDFIIRTNADFDAWCETFYTSEFLARGRDLHGLWAWREQQRRMDSLQEASAGKAIDVKAAASRLMGWKLPDNFCPDGYITFDREGAKAGRFWPIGTNLLTCSQAEDMLNYALGVKDE